jgi:hypothetical protein
MGALLQSQRVNGIYWIIRRIGVEIDSIFITDRITR